MLYNMLSNMRLTLSNETVHTRDTCVDTCQRHISIQPIRPTNPAIVTRGVVLKKEVGGA